MSVIDQIAKALTESVRNANSRETVPYDTQATVIRVDGDIAWVHIPGGVDETPVSLTVDAKQGDIVQVRVSGGTAWIIGNATSPPTDDTVANEAVHKVSIVRKAVDAVARIAGNTAQYFWHTENGSDTGAHITEIPQEQFQKNPRNGGGNLLMRSNGIAVRDGLDELSTFSRLGVDIGKAEEQQIQIRKTNVAFLEGGRVVAYISEDKGNFINFEVTDAFYLGNYALRQDREGTLVIGRRK